MADLIIYNTESEALAALLILEETAKQLWAAAGYTVDGHSIIGKNALNGQDEPGKARITGWDEVRQYGDKWGFISPRRRYPNYFDQLVTGDYQEATL